MGTYLHLSPHYGRGAEHYRIIVVFRLVEGEKSWKQTNTKHMFNASDLTIWELMMVLQRHLEKSMDDCRGENPSEGDELHFTYISP